MAAEEKIGARIEDRPLSQNIRLKRKRRGGQWLKRKRSIAGGFEGFFQGKRETADDPERSMDFIFLVENRNPHSSLPITDI